MAKTSSGKYGQGKYGYGKRHYDGTGIDDSYVVIGLASGKVMTMGTKADCFKWINSKSSSYWETQPNGRRISKWKSGLSEAVNIFRIVHDADRFETRQARQRYGIEENWK
ncbi:hypothetical protein PQ472_07885 [Lacticaseibacillus pabuli]|uniref:Uncharacterized protein n=1 Tax=Lacticaseibacillus pabuli TaxID=3025672 RepID=A0ABY7WRU9_9LACO|nr:hypothetical protein [Lacticaseibacillus sp. KACC 23028]WDF81845.1 hypothetical protein PQ472_07885 [Lacticaseibacillus sp. KACC 23028]